MRFATACAVSLSLALGTGALALPSGSALAAVAAPPLKASTIEAPAEDCGTAVFLGSRLAAPHNGTPSPRSRR